MPVIAFLNLKIQAGFQASLFQLVNWLHGLSEKFKFTRQGVTPVEKRGVSFKHCNVVK